LRKVERNSILFIWSADWANSRPSLTLLYRVKKSSIQVGLLRDAYFIPLCNRTNWPDFIKYAWGSW